MGKKWKAMKNPWQLHQPTRLQAQSEPQQLPQIQILKSKR